MYGPTKMKNIILTLFIGMAIQVSGQVNSFEWIVEISGPGNDYIVDVESDDQGNTYATGYFQDTANIGATQLVSAGGFDILLAKLDTVGVLLWALQIGGSGDDFGLALTVDGQGNPWVTGSFTGPVDFEGTILNGLAGLDMFIARFDPLGNMDWAKEMTSPGDTYPLDMDNAGYDTIPEMFSITGFFQSPLNLDATTTLTGPGGNDVMVVNLDGQGNLDSYGSAGGPGDDFGNALGVDSNYLFIAGSFQTGAIFGEDTLPNAGNDDVFISQFDRGTGQFFGTVTAGGSGHDAAKGITLSTTGSGSFSVTGDFENTLSIGDTTITSKGGTDPFFARYKPNGEFNFVETFGGPGNDYGTAITALNNGQAVAIGSFNEKVYHDHFDTVPGLGGDDTYIIILDTAINKRNYALHFHKYFGGKGNDYLQGATYWNGDGEYTVAGSFRDRMIFDNLGPLISQGGDDAFISRTFPDAHMPPDTSDTTSSSALTYNPMNSTKLFPNPTANGFFLDLPHASGNEIVVSVHNIIGEAVYSGPFKTAGASFLYIDPGNLVPGSYVVSVRLEKEVITQKLIVR